ncbi:GAF domain-containing protein [Salibacterium sp. K-3]
MSIATDLATIRILGSFYQSGTSSSPLSQTVESLCRDVDYINWAGVYFHEGEHTVLHAWAGTDSDEAVMQSQLAFPIHDQNGTETGVLIVKSKQWIVFDVNDVPTLETVAAEIGKTH